MLKENKWKITVSSIVILLPILFGLIMWERLPEEMITHWGINGEADGWNSRLFTVFVLPVILLVTHWVCIIFTSLDRKNREQNKKVFGMIFWIMPVVSVFVNGAVYMAVFGKEFGIERAEIIIIGLMFVIIGNYLPKCKQNHTIGIKVSWALRDEENWNMTHRFGGKAWVIGGLLLMSCVFLPDEAIPAALVILLLVLAVLPMLYSYLYYKKQLKNGKKISTSSNTVNTKITIAACIFVGIVLAAVIFLLFSGDIEMDYGDSSFTIQADYWYDRTVDYSEIQKIEFREQDSPGVRTNGFGSLRLLMGAFKNSEFGNYTRYSYANCDSCIVIELADRILVLNGVDDQSTKEIYEQLLERTEAE